MTIHYYSDNIINKMKKYMKYNLKLIHIIILIFALIVDIQMLQAQVQIPVLVSTLFRFKVSNLFVIKLYNRYALIL